MQIRRAFQSRGWQQGHGFQERGGASLSMPKMGVAMGLGYEGRGLCQS